MAEGVYSRPDKADHAQTVLYEIYLLRFAKERLETAGTLGERCIFLEDFLLHYRNLIEFFGKTKRLRSDDLSILRPKAIWPGKVPDKAALDTMRTPGLWEKYDTSDNPESISKYLHHCTEHRVEFKQWSVSTMYEELEPAIETFKSMLPPNTVLLERLREPLNPASQADGASTAGGSRTWLSTRPFLENDR
jgi:hypothetical protein